MKLFSSVSLVYSVNFMKTEGSNVAFLSKMEAGSEITVFTSKSFVNGSANIFGKMLLIISF